MMVLFDFSNTARSGLWYPVNDVIMGGVSAGNLRIERGIARFSGTVSHRNNGGFASVRSKLISVDLSEYDGITITACGDLKTYKVNLRIDDSFDGIVYQARVQPDSGQWNDYRLPFSSFIPTFRGKFVAHADPLHTSSIATIGLMISDKQFGVFCLEIRTIKAF